jgi:hypothetical protein
MRTRFNASTGKPALATSVRTCTCQQTYLIYA